jgi:hypothetical protein
MYLRYPCKVFRKCFFGEQLVGSSGCFEFRRLLMCVIAVKCEY